jgi:hypothetical protein
MVMTNEDYGSKDSYWADKLFEVKAPVTLTFNLVTSKAIGVMYWS